MRVFVRVVVLGVLALAVNVRSEEEDPLVDFFKKTDKNNDGKLSKEELVAHYKTIKVAEANAVNPTGGYSQREAEEMYEMYHGPSSGNPDRVSHR
jgi:Ca2+-binding EF-hand superfamily protein